jgi:hypothetical protein
MPPSIYTTVDDYVNALSDPRKAIINTIRHCLTTHLDSTFQETIAYKMIGYVVPHSVFPDGYHCDPKQPLPFMNLASQKNHIALYCMCGYSDAFNQMVQQEFASRKLKLDMGRSCIRITEKSFLERQADYLAIIQKIAAFMTAQEWIVFYKKQFGK